MMADAYGKLTHRPGICLVTRGPGATNAAAGVHIAAQDSTPLILFIGQVARDAAGREAFQEVDFKSMFGSLAKRVDQIEDPSRIPEVVSRAFHTATNGRAGPVVVALPEDMLTEYVRVRDTARYQVVEASPGIVELGELERLLRAAQRPLAIIGGRGWSLDARQEIHRFASLWNLPVAAAFRYQDSFDNSAEQYVGDVGLGINPKLKSAIHDADLILAICVRLGEVTTSGYTIIDLPTPRQRLVHVYPGMEELGSVYRADLAINAGPNRFTDAIKQFASPSKPRWSEWCRQLRSDYLAWSAPQRQPGALQLGEVIRSLSTELPRDTIVTNGAGNYTAWVHRHHQYCTSRSQLAPTSGSMGYGLPAAIAAKLLQPQRTVIAFSGDGCFLMTSQELATAVQYELSLVVILVNNGMFGTIRMHQEKRYPGRVSGTDLVNPDFCKLAMAHGAHAERVKETKEFIPALQRALVDNRPSLIELIVDPDGITPAQTLAELRDAAISNEANT
jgi:acetolactate synthase-1/2/3 large subunit